eukprot:1046596-Prorocentrum_minimum.AAC.2
MKQYYRKDPLNMYIHATLSDTTCKGGARKRNDVNTKGNGVDTKDKGVDTKGTVVIPDSALRIRSRTWSLPTCTSRCGSVWASCCWT